MGSKLKLIGLLLGVVLASHAVGSLIDALRVPGVRLDFSPISHLADNSPAIGPADASKQVVIVTDYQCAVCRLDHAGLAEVMAARPDVLFVFKEWAILGPASGEAARVALASRYQGRYLAVRDSLMRVGRLNDASIRQAVLRAGGDWHRLQRDRKIHAAAIEAELARVSRQAFGLGLPGTPGYLIGDRLVIGRLSGRQLRRPLDRA